MELSADGSKVVYSTLATNAMQGVSRGAFLRDMNNPNPATATKLIAEGGSRPVVSDDGRYVGYNTLSLTGIFVKDMQTGRTLVVTPSAGSAGGDADTFRPEISGDGKFLIFASDLQLTANDTNSARDVYVADLRPWQAGSDAPPPLRLVSVGLNGLASGFASRPGINRDGSVLAFQSSASNLASGDTNGQLDAFVRDYRTNPGGVNILVSYDVTGKVPPAESSRPQLDDSGNVVAFVSTAGKIVNGDTNGKEDSFIRNWFEERTTGPSSRTFLLAVSPTGEAGVCPGIANVDEDTKAISTRPYLSGDGKAAVFVSGDCNLTPDAAHGGPDTNLISDSSCGATAAVGSRYRGLPAPARILDTRPGFATADGQFAGLGLRPGGSVLAGPSDEPGRRPGRCELGGAERHGDGSGELGVRDRLSVRAAAAARLEPELRDGPDRAEHRRVQAQRRRRGVPVRVPGGNPPGRRRRWLLPEQRRAVTTERAGAAADTRPGSPTADGLFAGVGLRPAGSVLALTAGGRAGVPAGAGSVVLNVTVTGPVGSGT